MGAAAGLLLRQFPLRPLSNETLEGKGSPETLVSGGSFAYFSSCWEKWAAGGTKGKAIGKSMPSARKKTIQSKGVLHSRSTPLLYS